MAQQRYFSKEELLETPSMKDLQDPNLELACRVKATTFTVKMGQKLKLTTYCICTATTYIHRFYMYFSFADVDSKKLSMAATFLAAKSTNEFRMMEHIIKTAFLFMDPSERAIDVKSEFYCIIKEEVLLLENALLQVLGFQVEAELPHSHVIKICQFFKGYPVIAKKSYYLATASLIASTMSVQYKPLTVACVCVCLSIKWSRKQVQVDLDTGKYPWFYFIDPSLTAETLKDLTEDLGKAILRAALQMSSPILRCVINGTDVRKTIEYTKTNVAENSKRNETLSVSSAIPTKNDLPKSEKGNDDAGEIKNFVLNFVQKDAVVVKPYTTSEASETENSISDEKKTNFSKRPRWREYPSKIVVSIPRNMIHL